MTKTANIMTISGHPATINYEDDIKAFRGVFLNTTGYCDFVSNSIDGLEQEGRISMQEYVETCNEEGIEAFKEMDKPRSFTLRYPGWLEARLNAVTQQHSVSKNQYIVELLERELVSR